MRYKLMGIFVIMLMILTVFCMSGISEKNIFIENKEKNNYPMSILGEFVDQSQIIDINHGYWLVKDRCRVAQAFRPTLSTHTNIRLKLSRYNEAIDYDLILYIRNELDGEDLYSTVFDGSRITSHSGKWYTFPIDPPLDLIPGDTYFIIIESTGGEYNNCYLWSYNADDVDPYCFGDPWDDSSTGGLWAITHVPQGEYFDYCFMTICWNNPPETPSINGPTTGNPNIEYEYTVSTTDADNHNISYFVDWGDGTTDYWTMYTHSGEEITLKHIWAEEGTFLIRAKARDEIYEEVSDWATLEINMPKSNQNDFVNRSFLRMLERFPFLQSLFFN